MTKFKSFLKIVSIIINVAVIAFLIFYFIWEPYRKAKVAPNDPPQDNLAASVGTLGMPYSTFAGSNQIKSTSTTQTSAPITSKIKTSIDQYFLPDDNVYIFSSQYDYFNNPKGKTDSQMEKEILGLAGTSQCSTEPDFVIETGCYEIQKTNHADFTIELSKSYAYYIIPVSMGAIASQTFGDGFIVNKFHVNNFLQKKISLHASDGSKKDYYLYVFPAYNDKYLAGPFSGVLSITSP